MNFKKFRVSKSTSKIDFFRFFLSSDLVHSIETVIVWRKESLDYSFIRDEATYSPKQIIFEYPPIWSAFWLVNFVPPSFEKMSQRDVSVDDRSVIPGPERQRA